MKQIFILFLLFPICLFSQIKIDTQTSGLKYITIMYEDSTGFIQKKEIYSSIKQQLYFSKTIKKDSIFEFQYTIDSMRHFLAWKGMYKINKKGRKGVLYQFDSKGEMIAHGELVSDLSYVDTVTLYEYTNNTLRRSYTKLMFNDSKKPYNQLINGRDFINFYTEYHPNGNKKWEGKYDKIGNMTRQGVWKEYFENGKVKSEGEYKTGIIVPRSEGGWGTETERKQDKIGTWKYYSSDGVLIETKEYSIIKHEDELHWE